MFFVMRKIQKDTTTSHGIHPNETDRAQRSILDFNDRTINYYFADDYPYN